MTFRIAFWALIFFAASCTQLFAQRSEVNFHYRVEMISATRFPGESKTDSSRFFLEYWIKGDSARFHMGTNAGYFVAYMHKLDDTYYRLYALDSVAPVVYEAVRKIKRGCIPDSVPQMTPGRLAPAMQNGLFCSGYQVKLKAENGIRSETDVWLNDSLETRLSGLQYLVYQAHSKPTPFPLLMPVKLEVKVFDPSNTLMMLNAMDLAVFEWDVVKSSDVQIPAGYWENPMPASLADLLGFCVI